MRGADPVSARPRPGRDAAVLLNELREAVIIPTELEGDPGDE
jgi:hypothetical protein